MHPAFAKTTRLCCICGKALRQHRQTVETTYGFKTILAKMGFQDRGFGFDKAHPSCVMELGMERRSPMQISDHD
jgi:hypothetical protein